MVRRQHQLVLDTLAAALNDPATDDGWLTSREIEERSGVHSTLIFGMLLSPHERGDVLRDPYRNPDKSGLCHFRLTDQGFRRWQRESVPRQGLLQRFLQRLLRAIGA